MPDFDTRRPQEPDRPSRLHMFVVASKQHISAVGQWSKRTMIRHWRLGLSVSFLAVLAGTLTAWAVETHSEQVDQKLDWAVETPREQLVQQLGQEIKLPPTPEYRLYYEASTLSGGGSSAAADCVFSRQGHYDGYACEDVITKVTGPVKLASITEELKADPNSGSVVAEVEMGDSTLSDIDVMKVSFRDSELGDTQFSSYCFETEGLAADALRGHSDDVERPVLAGQTDNCYAAVYEVLIPNP